MPDIKQVIVRLDITEHTAFKAAAEAHDSTMQTVLLHFVKAYIAGHEQRAILHLNGELCPISQTVLAIAAAVELEIQSRARLNAIPNASQV